MFIIAYLFCICVSIIQYNARRFDNLQQACNKKLLESAKIYLQPYVFIVIVCVYYCLHVHNICVNLMLYYHRQCLLFVAHAVYVLFVLIQYITRVSTYVECNQSMMHSNQQVVCMCRQLNIMYAYVYIYIYINVLRVVHCCMCI